MKPENLTEQELKNMQKPSNDFYTLLGVVVPKQKCAVKVVETGEHCPETGIYQIDNSEDYLCDKCYKNWIHRHQ
jgi:hypothetical protein